MILLLLANIEGVDHGCHRRCSDPLLDGAQDVKDSIHLFHDMLSPSKDDRS